MDDIVRPLRRRETVLPAQLILAIIQLSGSCRRDGPTERARLLDLAAHLTRVPGQELDRLRAYAESLLDAESPDGGK